MDNINVKQNRLQACRPGTRRLIQLYSALLYNAHLRGFIDGEIYQGKAKFACVPGFNCYSCPGAVGACPLGALQNALASTGHRAGWYMLGMLLLFGTVLGRTICGWLCPLGLIQELLHKIPTFKLRKSRVTRLLSYLKYVFLAVFVIAIPLWYGLKHDMPMPGFCKYICPAGTLEGAMGLLSNPGNSDLFGMLGLFFTRKCIIMVVIGLTCIFCYRSFCRFICPLGAIYGLFNRFCLVGVRVDTDKCNGCGNCVRHCGMDVRHVGDHECINCAKCMDVCAQKAISLQAGKITLKAPKGTVGGEEQKKRKNAGRIAWGVALAVLCFALLWFNFLDPAVRSAASNRAETPVPQNTAEPAEPPAAEREAEAPAAQRAAEAPVGFEVGEQLEDFTITCLDGSEFRLADTRGKVTFLNLWATYCTPCVQELPHFDALAQEHGDDIAVLAVHSSVVTDDPAEYLADKGYSIPFALDTEDDMVWHIVNGSSTLPQTIVLDRNGVVVYNQKGSVTPEVLAALYEQASASGGETVPAAEDTAESSAVPAAAVQEAEDAYTVVVTDEAGEPVPGVTIQFCSDVACMTGVTGADGAARFDQEAGAYTIHLLKVPDGYAPDGTEYTAPEQPGTMTLVLQAAEAAEASEDGTAAELPDVIDEPRLGLHYEAPEEYKNLKGTLSPDAAFLDSGLLRMEWQYYAVAPDQWDAYSDYGDAYIEALENDGEIPESPDPSWMSGREHAFLYAVFAIDGNRGEDELRALLREYNAPFDDNFTWLEEVCKDGDTTFYVGQYARNEERMDEYREAMGDFFPEFEDLYNDRETFLSSITLSRPQWPTEWAVGDVIRFETTDLDGSPVNSEDLFAGSKVTMINVWGTWCAPCKGELPELGALAKEYEDQGFQIVGICNDAFQEDKAELARTLLAEAGAEYPCLVGSEALDDYFQMTTFPTSFLVDSEGRLLLEPISGAKLDLYPQAISDALAMADLSGQASGESSASAEEDPGVIDEPMLGMHYEPAEKYKGIKGCFTPDAAFLEDGLLQISWIYFAATPEQADAYLDYLNACAEAVDKGTEPPEAPDPSWETQRIHAPLFTVFAINGDRGEDELRALIHSHLAPMDELSLLEEIGRDGDTTFYLCQFTQVGEQMDEYREAMGDFFPEFEDLYSDKETFLSSFTFRRPEWVTGLAAGDIIRFETTDLDGDPVSSADLFAGSKVTMINVWGTWCAPCKKELPELGSLAKEYEDQGFQIIGICNDAFQEDKAELAKSLLAEAGADYLCLTGSEELDDYFLMVTFPSSFFVDSEGRLLLDPVLGAAVDDYPQCIADALALAG